MRTTLIEVNLRKFYIKIDQLELSKSGLHCIVLLLTYKNPG